MVFAAPELIETQPVDVFHEVEVAAELQHWVLTNGMMRG
jgi:hypothetical protein